MFRLISKLPIMLRGTHSPLNPFGLSSFIHFWSQIIYNHTKKKLLYLVSENDLKLVFKNKAEIFPKSNLFENIF
jgi:hypothetical protein